MERLLTNKEFNELLSSIEVENHDSKSEFIKESAPLEILLEKLKEYWELVKTILNLIKRITPPETDKKIDQFIEIVDSLLDGSKAKNQSEILLEFKDLWKIIKPILLIIRAIVPPKAQIIFDIVIELCDSIAK